MKKVLINCKYNFVSDNKVLFQKKKLNPYFGSLDDRFFQEWKGIIVQNTLPEDR